MSQDQPFSGIATVNRYELGGSEPQGTSRTGQTVLARLMKSQIWHLPAGFVALCGEGSEKEKWPLLALLPGRKLSPSSHPDARHFSSSPYASGTFQSASAMLELRGSKSMQGPLEGTAWDPRSLSCTDSILSGFYGQKL